MNLMRRIHKIEMRCPD